MAKTFRCAHCHEHKYVNPRLKGRRHYCGSAACQQARKNAWERKKLQKDADYQSKRKASKDKWRASKPCYDYQRRYRESHPEYVKKNREKQRLRNSRRNESEFLNEIIKMDALNTESLVASGLYALFPYNMKTKKKIVKTDALILQLSNVQINEACLMNNSP